MAPALQNSQIGFVFTIISIIGGILLILQGRNNHVFENAEQACHQRLVETKYFNLESLDKVCCVIVAFFWDALQHPATMPILQSFAGVLFTSLALIKFSASSSKSGWITLLPVPAGILCQLAGAAIAVPLTFSILWYIGFGDNKTSAKAAAKGWLPAHLVAFLAPAALFMVPELGADVTTRQKLIAWWTFFSIAAAVLRPVFAIALPIFGSPKSTYTAIAAISAPLHWYGVYLFVTNFSRQMFVPFIAKTPAQGGAFFLLADYIVTTLACALFVIGKNEQLNVAKYGIVAAVAGPGTAIALAAADTEDVVVVKAQKTE
ncbi:hypothetical protein OIO90_003489 [Microbotryomycetes sp. JL221]|nr:hypothetical protein OIO90_003489 [Microbotryomycetes sp. JL221]